MIQRQKDKYTGYGISLIFHVLIFIVVCFTGLFAKVSSDAPHDIDVDVYEIAQDTGGGGGGGSTDSPAMEAEAGADDIAFSVENEKLPEIAEEYTKEPEKQQQYRQEHHAAEAAVKSDNTSAGKAENPSAVTGQGGTGSGTGTGNGPGAGTGEGGGSGTGNGNGIGNGDGTGAGIGRDEAAAKVAKVAPVFQGGSNPVYPQDLQEQGIGGTVVLRLTVSAGGSVEEVDIASASGIRELDRAAVKAAYTYRFIPARNVYDEPVACIMNKKVVFVP